MLSEQESFSILHQEVKDFPQLLIMLGSGWNKVLEAADKEAEMTYEELFGVETSVPGHSGKLVIASVAGKRVLVKIGFLINEGKEEYEAFTRSTKDNEPALNPPFLLLANRNTSEKLSVRE